MRQWRLELFEDVAVHFRRMAVDLESGLLAEVASRVADQPREPAGTVGKRSHAADDYLTVQPRVEVFGLPGVVVKLADPFGQHLPTLGGESAGLGDRAAE